MQKAHKDLYNIFDLDGGQCDKGSNNIIRIKSFIFFLDRK